MSLADHIGLDEFPPSTSLHSLLLSSIVSPLFLFSPLSVWMLQRPSHRTVLTTGMAFILYTMYFAQVHRDEDGLDCVLKKVKLNQIQI